MGQGEKRSVGPWLLIIQKCFGSACSLVFMPKLRLWSVGDRSYE